MNIAVVGSGPSGWATALKLIELGHNVTVFDGGVSKESHISNSSIVAINQKLLRGSDFPYRMFQNGPTINQQGTNLAFSFATAGLSLVWGATMLPYSFDEFDLWPLKFSDMDMYYRQISETVPISGVVDSLEKKYEPYLSRPPLLSSTRVMKFLEEAKVVANERISVGASRLAIKSRGTDELSCNYCGSCLVGCPRNLIWYAPPIKNNKINYVAGVRLLSLSENKLITLNFVDKNAKESNYNFDKVFLATGNIETFRILATSKIIDSKADLLDSATFFIPFRLKSRYGKPEKAKYSLSQAFIRIEDDCYKPLQIQIYDFSEDLVERAQKRLPLGEKIPKWILRIPLRRLFVGIGYLDGFDSPLIRMQLADNGDVELTPVYRDAKSTQSKVEEVLKNNREFFRKVGLVPIKKLIQYALPGEGVHAGGWLPMGVTSDVLGRPHGLRNVHVVDSSIFPTIPAGAITYTVMANAMRIAEEACK